MIRRAMILAAGYGTRLRPLTQYLPKPLVPVLGQSLIEHHLQRLKKLGIQEVMINVHHLGDRIIEAIGDGSRWDMHIHYSQEPAEALGTGGGLAKVRDFFVEEEAFLFLNGDILHDIDLRSAIEAHRQNDAVGTLIVRSHPGDPNMGWIGLDRNGWVKRVPEMNGEGPWQKVQFAGLHVLSPRIFDYMPKEGSFCILRAGYRSMLEDGLAVWAHHAGCVRWSDIGTPDSYLAANLEALQHTQPTQNNNVSTHFPQATIRQPVWIGDQVTIEEGAEIGPYVILGDHTKVGAQSRLRYSVVLPHTTLPAETTLDQSLAFAEHRIHLPDAPLPT